MANYREPEAPSRLNVLTAWQRPSMAQLRGFENIPEKLNLESTTGDKALLPKNGRDSISVGTEPVPQDQKFGWIVGVVMRWAGVNFIEQLACSVSS